MTRSAYRRAVTKLLVNHVAGLFVSGWSLMLALGIVGLNLGYWPSFAAAWLLNVTIDWPADEVKVQALKRKYGRDW